MTRKAAEMISRLVQACRMVDRLEKAVSIEFETNGPDEKRTQERIDARAAIIAALVSGEMP